MNSKSAIPGDRKDLALSIVMAGIVAVPAFLFSLKSDLPHVFAITALILGYSILRRRAVELSDRPIIYFLVVSASLSTFLDMAIPMSDARTGILDILIKSSLSAPALLYLAAFTSLFKQRPAILGVVVALSVAVMIVGGDFFRGPSLTPERMFFAKPLTDKFAQLYVLCVALEIVFIVGSLRLIGRHSERGVSRKALVLRDSFRAICLALLPLLAIGGTMVFYANENSIRALERFLATGDWLRRAQQEPLPFPDESDISKGFPKEDPAKAARIIARVKAKSPPGLLRARCYVDYTDGRWSTADSGIVQLQGQRGADAVTSSVFNLPAAGPPSTELKQRRLEIFQSTSFAHELLLAPANANAVELVADKLGVTQDGLLEPGNWKPDAGFTAFVDSIDQNAAYRGPASPVGRPGYLAFPARLGKALSEISSQAVEMASRSRQKGDAALVEAVGSIIRNRCQYSLVREDTPAGRDPVEEFLVNTRKGHCELFASSAVLTLRSMGIPARYVTGLVCDETHPSGTYYVARVGGAHAWCEAYLRDQGRWGLVEATPASAFDALKPAWGFFDALTDWIAQSFRHSMAWLQRGYFAQAIIELLSDAALMVWSVVASKIGIALEIALAALASAFFIRRFLKRRRLAAMTPLPLRRLKDEFARLEVFASARSGVSRSRSMTVREWAVLSGGVCGDRLLELVGRYEGLRFRAAPPGMDDVKAFAKEVSAFRSVLR